ncbi:MAG: hypothetical protein AAGE52_03640 [Myxococcota bacterium]
MSDYQLVTVRSKEDRRVTVEVEESPDSRALSSLFNTGKERGVEDDVPEAQPKDWVAIGAMLLLEEKAREGEIFPEDDVVPEPGLFVERVERVEATVLGTGSANNPYYRAILRITLVDREHADLFEVGDSFGAVADLFTDFEEMFD